MKELAGHAPPRYELDTPSCDDWGETLERGRALESTTYTQMLSRDDSTIRAIAGSSKRVLRLAESRSRDHGCPQPPPRIRTSGFPASGSCLR